MIPRRGYTLIELLIVIMIIGLLVKVVIPQFQKFKQKQLEEGDQKIEQVYKEKKSESTEISKSARTLIKLTVIGTVSAFMCFVIAFLVAKIITQRRRMARFNRTIRDVYKRSAGHFFHDEDEFQRRSRELDERLKDIIGEDKPKSTGVRRVRRKNDDAGRILDKVREQSKGPLSSMWRHIRRAAESMVGTLFRENQQPPMQK